MDRLERSSPLNTDEQTLIDQKTAEESRKLNHLQNQIRELQARLQESSAQHHERIRELNYQRNTHSAIIRLALEILHRIFQDLQDLYTAAESGSRRIDTRTEWRKVLHVCQHWRSLAINAASLWTIIPHYPSRWSEMALERSAAAILDVFFLLRQHHLIGLDEAKTIMKTIVRIRTMEIKGYAKSIINWDKFQAFLDPSSKHCVLSSGETKSVLERLSIDLTSGSSVPTLSISWFIIAPRLQHLQLSGIDFDWTASHFRNIRTLHVMNVPTMTKLALDRIPTVFGQMSSLEDLNLSNIFSRDDGTLPSARRNMKSRCNLPKLKKLRIESAFSSSVALFLSSLSFPTLDYLHVMVQHSGTNAHSKFLQALSMLRQRGYDSVRIRNAAIPNMHPMLIQNQIQYMQQISFEMYFDAEGQGYDQKPFQILLPVANMDVIYPRVMTKFCAVADFSCLKHLVVKEIPREVLITTFGSLPHLMFVMTLCEKTFTNLIEALLIPVDHPQHSQLIFPALKSITASRLSLDDYSKWEPLQDCLMQRYEYGAPIDSFKLLDPFGKLPPDCVTKLSEFVPHVTT
ncbi:hypothetical protein D9619_006195 [Psilocybe cf. subviscida]|uniref:F-box domain-containing protein n=1 Tax=Psilocybe cf. subviscida TaxID=2480587 RepID=A0A8H5EY20_9AGAR|nr:hypothetical protein D9619_006195 [Psilocybe cf. subviscida]